MIVELLDTFKLYRMSSGFPSVTFSKNGLGISKAAVAKLDNSPYAKIMFDASGKRMAIVKCGKDDDGAVSFAKPPKDGVRWNTQDLSDTIKQITKWSVDNGERYVINGEYHEIEDIPMLIFDFQQAKNL